MAARPKNEDRTQLHTATNGERPPALFSMAEVRHLIALMDGSDLTEITVEQPDSGMRLVLRRVIEVVGSAPVAAAVPVAALAAAPMAPPVAPVAAEPPAPEREFITAPIVGTFHPGLGPRTKPLVQVGDTVSEGQVVGSIETLNVMNDVEAQVAGKVVAILVAPGQPVEYGQHLVAVQPK
jgi:acetyl-CoA carboxylase biotin carboxyl carrier protein